MGAANGRIDFASAPRLLKLLDHEFDFGFICFFMMLLRLRLLQRDPPVGLIDNESASVNYAKPEPDLMQHVFRQVDGLFAGICHPNAARYKADVIKILRVRIFPYTLAADKKEEELELIKLASPGGFEVAPEVKETKLLAKYKEFTEAVKADVGAKIVDLVDISSLPWANSGKFAPMLSVIQMVEGQAEVLNEIPKSTLDMMHLK